MDTIKVFQDADQVAQAALDYVLEAARESIAERGIFNLDLAGGSTPQRLYELLAEQKATDWSKWHFFMGDERFVPLDDERSNFGLVQTTLLNKLTIADKQVHLIPVNLPSAEAAAQAYEQEIRHHFGIDKRNIPVFDLVLLGMGPDAHTASLFPGKAAVNEKKKLVTASEPGLPPLVDRVTFTLPLINAARRVLFITAGANKAGAFAKVRQDLAKEPDETVTPAGKVRPVAGELHWFIDQAVAGN